MCALRGNQALAPRWNSCFPHLCIPSFPWLATVWTCPVELREGHGGCVPVCTQSFMSESSDTMDCSPPGSFVLGVSQARILEWVVISFSRGSSWPREWTETNVSCNGRQILYHWRHLGSPWRLNEAYFLPRNKEYRKPFVPWFPMGSWFLERGLRWATKWLVLKDLSGPSYIYSYIAE